MKNTKQTRQAFDEPTKGRQRAKPKRRRSGGGEFRYCEKNNSVSGGWDLDLFFANLKIELVRTGGGNLSNLWDIMVGGRLRGGNFENVRESP